MLKVQNVSFSHCHEQVLEKISYTFLQNSIYLLDGPSGVGKSTLMKILAGLERQQSGDIVFADSIQFSDVYYLPYQSYFPWLTIKEHFLLLNSQFFQIRDFVHLIDELEMKPLLNKKPLQLSLGQLSRFYILLSDLKDNKIILLDEVFSSLNQNLAEKTIIALKSRWKSKNKCVVLTSHQSDWLKPFIDFHLILSSQNLNEK